MADSVVNSIVGGISTMGLMQTASMVAAATIGRYCGPVGSAICAVTTTALLAPRITKAVNERIRSKPNILLRSVEDLEQERKTAFDRHQKYLRREKLIAGLDDLFHLYNISVTIDELEANREPHVIWSRGKAAMLLLHPDRRVHELNSHMEQVKATPEYHAMDSVEQSRLILQGEDENLQAAEQGTAGLERDTHHLDGSRQGAP